MALKRGDVLTIVNPLTLFRSEFGAEEVGKTVSNTEYQVFCISDSDDLQSYREMNPNDKEAEIRVRLRTKDGNVVGWVSLTEIQRSTPVETKKTVSTPVTASVQSVPLSADTVHDQIKELLQHILNEYGDTSEYDYPLTLGLGWDANIILQAITNRIIIPVQPSVYPSLEFNYVPLQVKPDENFEDVVKELGLKSTSMVVAISDLKPGAKFCYRGVEYTKVDTVGFVGISMLNNIPKMVTLKNNDAVLIKGV